jgi:hypothetical protein
MKKKKGQPRRGQSSRRNAFNDMKCLECGEPGHNLVMSARSLSASFILGPPPYDQTLAGHPKFLVQELQEMDRREGSKTRTLNNIVPETKHIY